MGNTKIKIICLVVCFCCLTGCALVRMTGRVASAAGGEMIKSADEEEAKGESKAADEEVVKEESKINSEGTNPSSESMTVLQVQQRLIELGYNPGPADGIMGKSTVSALKKFQQDNSLSITGRADSETVAKLR